MSNFRRYRMQKSKKKVVFGRSSEIDLEVGRKKSTSTDRLRPTLNTSIHQSILNGTSTSPQSSSKNVLVTDKTFAYE